MASNKIRLDGYEWWRVCENAEGKECGLLKKNPKLSERAEENHENLGPENKQPLHSDDQYNYSSNYN